MIRSRIFYLFLPLLVLCTDLQAQQDTAYVRTVGGGSVETGADLQLTKDGGVVMVGSTSSFGEGQTDFYVVKLDSNLNIQWSKTFGRSGIEVAQSVKQTIDSGYVIAGYTNTTLNGGYDYYVVRINKKGELLWEKTFGGDDWDLAHAVVYTSDEQFIVAGESYSNDQGKSNAWVIRLNAQGNIVWEKNFGGKNNDHAYGLIETLDTNYVLCGVSYSRSDTSKGDSWWLKFNDDGDSIKSVYHPTAEYDYAKDLVATKDSGWALIGTSESNNVGDKDIMVLKYNKEGNYVWEFYHGLVVPPNLGEDFGEGIKEYDSGNLLITGTSFLGNTGLNIYTAMIDGNNGSHLTAPSYGGFNDDFGVDCEIIPGGGEYFMGTTQSYDVAYEDFVIIKVDTVDGGKFELVDPFEDNLQAPPNAIATPVVEESYVKLYPVPFDQFITLETGNEQPEGLLIFNIAGSLVHQQSFEQHADLPFESQVDLSELKPGRYLIQVVFADHREVKSVEKLR